MKHKVTYRLLLLAALCFTMVCESIAQCTIEFNQDIADDAETSFLISVDGLINPNLDDPAQGLCGIRVDFSHSQIGDLILTLRSPSGDEVQLTGPQVVTTPTLGASFNVTFVRCSDTAIPDPSFTPTWSNNQAWSIFGNYTGSYYPFSGCLEGFSGSANGLWQLIALDAQGQDVGEIDAIELIFCDPNGLNCLECEADGGALTSDTLFHCINQDSIYFDFSPSFNHPLDTTLFAHYYIVSANNQVIDVVDEVYAGTVATGTYQVCGIAVQHTDTSFIQTFPPNITLQAYEAWLLDTEKCFHIGTTCATLVVEAELPPIFHLERICAGDTLYWRGNAYTEAGNYQVREPGENSCNRDFFLSLLVIDPEPSISLLDDFGCSDDEATLLGQDINLSNASLSWFTLGGTILSGHDTDSIKVSTSGDYYLVSSQMISPQLTCSDTTFITLENNFEEPQVGYLADTFTCIQDSLYAVSFTNIGNATIIWRNEEQVEDTMRNHDILIGEQYTLVAVSEQGCRDSIVVSLPYDTVAAAVELTDIEKICRDDSVLIQSDFYDPLLMYVWTDPLGTEFDVPSFNSQSNGDFYLRTTGRNGCVGMDTLSVVFTGTPPQLTILSDTFFCLTDSIQVRFQTGLNDSIISITGSNFDSDETDVYLTEQGQYDFSVLTTEGCYYDTSWQTTFVVDQSSLDIVTDTIDCTRDSVALYPILQRADFSYTWQGPEGYGSIDDTITVGLPGEYSLQVTTASGCVLEGSAVVEVDTVGPIVSLSADDLNCLRDSVQIQALGASTTYSYDWGGPNAFMSAQAEPWAANAGWYSVTIEKSNGCRLIDSIFIAQNIQVPTIDLTASVITCDQPTSQVDLLTDATQVEWRSENYFSADEDPILPRVDTFHLFLRGSNGCDTALTYTPPVDTIRPELQLSTSILGCLQDSVPITYIATLPYRSIDWIGPDGGLGSADTLWAHVGGNYVLNYVALNGCLSVDSVLVIQDGLPPKVLIGGDTSLNCQLDTAQLYALTSDSSVSYEWRFDNAFISIDSTIRVTEAGAYTLIVEDENMCSDTLSYVLLDETALPAIEPMADTINCSRPQATVEAILQADEIIEWIWPDNSITNDASFQTALPGIYKAIVYNERTFCVDSVLIEVPIDTMTITNAILSDTVITCQRDSIIMRSMLGLENAQLTWTGPSGTNTDIDSFLVVIPGMYYLQSTAASLCFDVDSVFIGSDTTSPMLVVYGDTITCQDPEVPVWFTTGSGELDFEWNGPNGFQASDSVIQVDVSGTYSIRTTDLDNGCSTIDSLVVAVDTVKPEVIVMAEALACSDSTALVEALVLDPSVEIIWTRPDFVTDTNRVITADGPGLYTIQAFGLNGCTFNDTLYLNTFDTVMPPLLNLENITCMQPTATHSVLHVDTSLTISWQQQGMEIGDETNVLIDNGLPIIISLENARGCSWDTTFTTEFDTSIHYPQIATDGSIVCAVDSMFLYIENPISNVNYTWTAQAGVIQSDASLDRIEIGAPGVYVNESYNSVNGCRGYDTIIIVAEEALLDIDSVTVEQLHCNNAYRGSIDVASVAGAVFPLTYGLNDVTSSLGYFQDLSAGDYRITVSDALGCIDTVYAVLDEVIPLQVDIESDTFIAVGTQLQIPLMTNIVNRANQYWTINGQTFCQDCDVFELQVLEEGYYAAFVEDENGCVASDSIYIGLLQIPLMYIPNAFSPNGDGVNDEFGPMFGGNVARVVMFRIYERWGNQVHFQSNIELNNPALPWDGTMRGQPLNPGIFIYHIDVELLNGHRVQRSGEVHLIR